LKLKYTHFPLHPDTPEEGRNRGTASPGSEGAARNMRMKALMEQEGLPYNSERTMTYNSRLAQELSKWAESKGKGDEVHDPFYRAFFVDVKNLAKQEVLVEIARTIGLPTDEAVEVIVSRSFKETVDADWRRCAEFGVNAVPTFVVNNRMLVGAHPYEELEKLVQIAS